MADGANIETGVQLVVPRAVDIAWLAARMRPDEIEQWCALNACDEYDPDTAARGFIAIPGPSWALVDGDGMPFVIGGLEPVRPGTLSCWMLGSVEGWAQHWRSITRWSRRLVSGALAGGHAHRVEVIAMSNRVAAHEWYARGMGMHYEGLLRGWFANGADAMIFARTASHDETRRDQETPQ